MSAAKPMPRTDRLGLILTQFAWLAAACLGWKPQR